jgi:hypothetical protein
MGGVNTGCGYIVSKRGNKINVKPTINFTSCNVVLGFGNAVFTIDPSNAPKALSAIITGDSNKNDISKEISYAFSRRVRSFNSVGTKSFSITDANGVTSNISIPLLNGFAMKLGVSNENSGIYGAIGTENASLTTKINW